MKIKNLEISDLLAQGYSKKLNRLAQILEVLFVISYAHYFGNTADTHRVSSLVTWGLLYALIGTWILNLSVAFASKNSVIITRTLMHLFYFIVLGLVALLLIALGAG